MNGQLQHDAHPEPDLLNAFVEGALAEHERLACMTHLAECARCREIAYLAQDPVESPAAAANEPAPKQRRWFVPPMLASAAAMILVIAAVSIFRTKAPVHSTPQIVADAMPPKTEIPQQPPASAVPAASRPRVAPAEAPRAMAAPKTIPMPTAPAPPAPTPLADAPQPPEIKVPPAAGALDSVAKNEFLPPPPTGIAGRVTDSAGGTIPGASITIAPPGGAASTKDHTNPQGQFTIAGLQPGRYDVRVEAPGFRSDSRQVSVQPNTVTNADAVLQVGSVSETVEVTAAAPAVQAETSMKKATAFKSIAALAKPRDLPTGINATHGKTIVTVDAKGALFVSTDAGNTWKAVPPVWVGKVVRVVAPPDASAPPAKSAFQLTTVAGVNWFSEDGSRWIPAAAPR